MNSLRSHIPNLFTLGNLLCGCIGIWMTIMQEIEIAFYFMLIGVGFDFLDGMAARALKATSDIGKQLDSLADLVTFGVLPGFLAMWLLENSPSLGIIQTGDDHPFALFGLLIPPAAALRLAKFNITPDQKGFSGLPTPISALVIGSIAFSLELEGVYQGNLASKELVLVIILVISLMMNSKISLISLKFSGLDIRQDLDKLLLIGGSLVAFVFLNFACFPVVLVLYILVSIIFCSKNEIQS